MNFAQQAYEVIQTIREDLADLSSALHSHPELAFAERFALEAQTALLKKWGFAPRSNVYSRETAFEANGHSDNGPVFAVCAEYDALPLLGHGCGHNLISAMALGAFYAVDQIIGQQNIPGQIRLLGTPGEESAGGKIYMLDAGCLDDVSAVMMVHPSFRTTPDTGSTSIRRFEVTFHGHSSHAAASPELGINALDAVMLLFNAVSFMRQQLPEPARIHGIVDNGGEKPNIIPDCASCQFFLRSTDGEWDEKIEQRFRDMVSGAALMTGTTADIKMVGVPYKARKANQMMNQLWCESMVTLNEIPVIPERGGRGSSDFGNFSCCRPGIHPYIGISPTKIAAHSLEFTDASASEYGFEQALKGAAGMAAVALKYLADPELQAQIQAEFEGK